ncbi:YjhX family toxin [Leisingera sp. McT4-56]|uniref:YjhX family toxin n=1 Tax=Leisingera sp. McT4-56 TaxID=2881255 RepID=UPI001CF8EEB7|nr:YjhX family toxin [Leisingera sp. McT4-56]MCB4457466.1 YjhX family toxin [Leisingera sp. McT4-56]
MNISKHEQRVLHELALGGEIKYTRADNGKVQSVQCFTRDGFVFSACTMDVFKRLKDKRFIKSKNGHPYRITHLGNQSVRSQMNQR